MKHEDLTALNECETCKRPQPENLQAAESAGWWSRTWQRSDSGSNSQELITQTLTGTRKARARCQVSQPRTCQSPDSSFEMNTADAYKNPKSAETLSGHPILFISMVLFSLHNFVILIICIGYLK